MTKRLQFVRKVRRTENHMDYTALASATDTVPGESKQSYCAN